MKTSSVKQDQLAVCNIAQQLYGYSWDDTQAARGFASYIFKCACEEDVTGRWVYISTPDLIMLAIMYRDGRYSAVVDVLNRLGVYYEQDSYESEL